MKEKTSNGLKVLRSGDQKSAFAKPRTTAEEVLQRLGRPKFLLSSSSKLRKGECYGISTKCLYLTSGLFCPAASKGCLDTCLGWNSGFMKEPRATAARDRRSALYMADRPAFMQMLKEEIHRHRYDAETQEMLPAIRLNGTSDIAWEVDHPELFADFSDCVFYDYTKLIVRAKGFGEGWIDKRYGVDREWPENYHLTFSLNERNREHARLAIKYGVNVAAVFWPDLPDSFREIGAPVIDGDKNDARFLDPSAKRGERPVCVGLRAKGHHAQAADRSGFVVRPRAEGFVPLARN